MSRTQEEINPLQSPVPTTAAALVTAGIDVGKSALDVFVHPVGIRLKATNDARGIEGITRVLAGRGHEPASAGSDGTAGPSLRERQGAPAKRCPKPGPHAGVLIRALAYIRVAALSSNQE